MAFHKATFALLLLPLLFPLLVSGSADSPSTFQHWCGRTPHPEPCKYYVAQSSHRAPVEASQVQRVMVQLAMEGVQKGQSHNQLQLGIKYRSKRERAAWADCVELYDTAVVQLNRTLSSLLGGTREVDPQTLLSAALTNLETCRTGFAELNLPQPTLPPPAPLLIRNSLAIGKLLRQKTGVPHWARQHQEHLLKAAVGDIRADLVVAQDGSGDYRTITEAVEAASKQKKGGNRFVIHVKTGVYKEQVEVTLSNLMLVGDGVGKTIITGSKSVGGGSTTFRSATFAVIGDGFIARDLTFRNTAGPAKHQAVAMRSGADRSAFYRCSFEGYQDTLYIHTLRQFYRDCDIYGTVDFIFGNAAAVFQNCNIYVRRPMGKQKNTITAQGRTDPNQNTGISIQNCRVTAAPDLKPVQSSFQTFLGRPWRKYTRTVYMQTYLDGLVTPAGWLEWSGSVALDNLYYGEYRNTGPGSSTARRVRWGGYHVISEPSVAWRFTVGNLISGEAWLPATGVPFTLGL